MLISFSCDLARHSWVCCASRHHHGGTAVRPRSRLAKRLANKYAADRGVQRSELPSGSSRSCSNRPGCCRRRASGWPRRTPIRTSGWICGRTRSRAYEASRALIGSQRSLALPKRLALQEWTRCLGSSRVEGWFLAMLTRRLEARLLPGAEHAVQLDGDGAGRGQDSVAGGPALGSFGFAPAGRQCLGAIRWPSISRRVTQTPSWRWSALAESISAEIQLRKRSERCERSAAE